jgi:hypothetical protein
MPKEWCELFPTPEEETCVCGGGSDISGATEDNNLCSLAYSEDCPYAQEEEDD